MKLPIFILGITLCFLGCEKAFISSPDVTPQLVFDEMWREIDENYSYFELKSVNWDSVYNVYAPQIESDMSDEALFNVCLAMLEELRDGHNSLFSPNTGDIRFPYEAGYPIFFDLEIIKS